MKLSLKLIICLFMSSSLFAQLTLEDYQMELEIDKMEKREIYEEFIGDDVNKDFWDIYNAYEDKRLAMEVRRYDLVKNYSKDYFKITNDQASNHLKVAEKLNVDFNKLITSYSNKIIKTHGGKVAMQFYQLELYFLAVSRTELIENIPSIAEMFNEK